MDTAALVVGMVFPDGLLYSGDDLFRQFAKEVGGVGAGRSRPYFVGSI